MTTFNLHPTFLRDVLGDSLTITRARIDFFFDEQKRRKGFRPAGHISNSSHFECARSTQAPRLGVKIDPGSDIFNEDYAYAAAFGDAVHEVLQDILWDSGLTIRDGQWKPDDVEKKEVTFGRRNLSPLMADLFETMDYSLRADGALYMSGIENSVWAEFKSKGGKYFSKHYEPYLNEALIHAEMQLQMALGFAEADYGFMVFVNRELNDKERVTDEQIVLEDYRVYTVEADRDYFTYRVAEISKTAQKVRKGQLPMADNTRGSCKFCKVAISCPVPTQYRKSSMPQYYAGIEEDAAMQRFMARN